MFTNTINQIKVLQHNVHHWPSKRISLINTYAHINPDVILINSHGLPNHQSIKIPGYTTYQANRTGELHAGVAIAVKRTLQHKIHDDFHFSDTLSIKLMTNLGAINIGTSYIPPREGCIMFPDIYKLLNTPEPMYILADLNGRHTSLGHTNTNIVGRNIMKIISTLGAQHIGPNFPTFIGHSALTTPDIILTNGKTYHNTHATQGPLTSSDHLPIIFTISTTPITIPCPQRLNKRKADWDMFQNIINAELPELNLEGKNIEDIENAVTTWYETIEKAQKTAIPTTTYRTLPHPLHNRDITEAQLRFTHILQYANIHGWTYDLYQQSRILQRTLQEKCKEEYNKHWENTVKGLAEKYHDPKAFWQGIKRLEGKPKKRPIHFVKDGRKIEDDEGVAQMFRDTWKTVFTITPEENAHYDNEHEQTIQTWLRQHNIRTTPHTTVNSLRPTQGNPLTEKIDEAELRTAIRNTKSTAPGRSRIDKQQITMLPQNAIKYLLTIYNAMINTGYFPRKYKEATITMIPKPGKPQTDPRNYRPISLLEVPGKIFERIINSRLRHHLQENNLYNPSQYGFRAGRSTTSAIAIASEKIALAKGQGLNCTIIQRDISKAFDKVWIQGLQYKLLQLGLPEQTERLLCNFLHQRTASISVNTTLSTPFLLQSGVPQGSVLSPTLFITYTSDVPRPINTNCMDLYYADDATQIVTSNTSPEGHDARVVREALRLNTYERTWKIKTNIDKFTIVALGRKKPNDLQIQGQTIQHQKHCQILGHTVTSTGLIVRHVNDKKIKAKIALKSLYRFWHFTEQLKLYLVKTKLLPILDYSPIPTHTASRTKMLELQRIQNKALRYVTDQRYPYTESTEAQHHRLNVQPISTRLREAAHKIWEKLDNQEDPNYTHVKEYDGNTDMDHSWFPRSLKSLREPPPDHRFTR